jgi:hypothetical protein
MNDLREIDNFPLVKLVLDRDIYDNNDNFLKVILNKMALKLYKSNIF